MGNGSESLGGFSSKRRGWAENGREERSKLTKKGNGLDG